MNTRPRSTQIQIVSGLWQTALALLLAGHAAHAQTLVSGNISGTWAPAGNPYIAVDNCTVPAGQTLTIQPGVVVWIGSNVTITANGVIQAVGTPSQRIKFQSPAASQYWNRISLIHEAGINLLKYCDFQNAQAAITMHVSGPIGGDPVMVVEVESCTFSNCLGAAIYGEAQGSAGFVGIGDFRVTNPILSPLIKNCIFDNTSVGCVLNVFGYYYQGSTGSGHSDAKIVGNVFKNIGGTAFLMVAGSYAGNSSPVFLNNTVVNCGKGVESLFPWDAKIQSCIFVGCSNAVMRSGSLSGIVAYNDFYQNATNFTGYPGTYGAPIIANRNGTSSDVLFNIFQNPLFVGASDYHLTASSTCIDAGVGDPANFDSCFPPSLGSVTNDIGAYGGPGGCEWISPPSTNIFTVALAKYVGVTINPPTNGNYRLEFAPVLGNTNDWTQLTNLNLSAPFIYYDPVLFGQRYYRAVLLP